MMGPLFARLVVQGSIQAATATPCLDEQMRAAIDEVARGGSLVRDRRGARHGAAFLGALLNDLPIGVCALDHEVRIVLYNRTMEGS